jgi:uncharacterized protein (DUF2384 family)
MFTEQKIVSVLGGQTSLGRKVKSPLDLDKLIREGLPYKAGSHVRGLLDLPLAVFASVIDVSERTLARVRKSPNQRLSSAASDRLYRLADLFAPPKSWRMRKGKSGFDVGGGIGQEHPWIAANEAGAKEVEDLLWRIEYGVIS